MLEKQTEKRWNVVVKDDLKKLSLDRGFAKNKERLKAQVTGKTSNLCERGQRTCVCVVVLFIHNQSWTTLS